MIQKILALVAREPAVVVSVALAVLELVASFGLNLTDRQTSSITALLTVVAGIVTRSQVSPVSATPAVTITAPPVA